MTIQYIPYFPEPVNGQAILSNFNRVLTYKGSNDLGTRLVRGMPLYEAELKETVGQQNSGNYVFRGDCTSTCAYLKKNNIRVDLVYIDPPFASGADYAKTIFLRDNPKIAEKLENAEKELDIDELKSFEEKMYGDIWDKEKYLNWMYENLLAIKSIMSDTASIYVHLDWHIGHYVKILMDEIFGEENFKNEIIWAYRRWSAASSGFQNSHDVIYWYTRRSEYTWNTVYEKYADGGAHYTEKDENGEYRWQYLNGEKYKLYKKEGTRAKDWWDDIPYINSMAKERLDYATQKPEALLERIITASSNEGMIVADFFGGSGVTAAVSSKLNRAFIHCDVNINSIQTTRDRLISNGASFDIMDIKDGVSLYRNPVQTMNKLKTLVVGLRNENSLDKFWGGAINDPKLGLIPVYIPNLMDSSTRILDDVLMRRILHEAMPDLDKNTKKVIVYYIDIENKSAIDNLIKDDVENDIEIEFRDLKEILDDIVVEDTLDYSINENKEKLNDSYVIDIKTYFSDAISRRISSFNLKSAQNNKKGTFKPIVLSKNGLELIELISVDCSKNEGPWHSDYDLKIGIDSNIIVNGSNTKSKWDGKVIVDKKPMRIKVRNICGDETIFVV
jgi:adenine-specific DNA-methyltransferase